MILVARSWEQAQATAERLRGIGHAPLVAPVLERHATGRPLPPGPFDAVAIASANALAALGKRGDIGPLRRLPLLTVGERTARAGREAGFRHVRSAGGDRHALARLALSTLPPGGRLLALLGRDHHADWMEAVRAGGRGVETAILYETRAAERLPEAARQAIGRGEVGAVLHYSPRSARLLLDLAAREGLGGPFAACLHACLSPAVAEPLREAGVNRIVAASAPEEDALLQALLCALPAPSEEGGVAQGAKLAYNRDDADEPGAAAMTMDDGRSGGRKAGRRREPPIIEGQAVPGAAGEAAADLVATGEGGAAESGPTASDRPETPEKSAVESAEVLMSGGPEEGRPPLTETEPADASEAAALADLSQSRPDESRPVISGEAGPAPGASPVADDTGTGARASTAPLEPRRPSRLPLIAASLAAGLLGGVAGTAATQFWPGLRQAEAGRNAAVQERIAALETQLNARLSGAAPAATVNTLAQRVETLAPASAVAALAQRLDALAPRVEGQASTTTSTQGELQRLAAGITAQLQELRAGLGQVQELRAGLGQIGELRAGLTELQGLRGSIDELRVGIAEARTLSAQLGELRGQLGEAQALARRGLEAAEAAASAPDADEQARATLAQMQGRLGIVESAIARFEEAQAGVSRQIGRVEGEIGQRVADTARGVADLTRRVGELGPSLADITRRVEEGARASADLSRRVEEVGQRSVQSAAGLEDVTRRVGENSRNLGDLARRVEEAGRTGTENGRRIEEAAGRLADNAKLLRGQALAAQVSRAVEAGAPFEAEIEALRGLGLADAGKLAPLAPLAKAGAPTPAALAQEFAAARGAVLDAVARAGRREEAPYTERVLGSLGSIVQVRPATGGGGAPAGGGAASGSEPGALVQRIEAALARGDVADAAAAWGALPEPARAASRAFGERLRSREAALAAADALTRSTAEALAKSAS